MELEIKIVLGKLGVKMNGWGHSFYFGRRTLSSIIVNIGTF